MRDAPEGDASHGPDKSSDAPSAMSREKRARIQSSPVVPDATMETPTDSAAGRAADVRESSTEGLRKTQTAPQLDRYETTATQRSAAEWRPPRPMAPLRTLTYGSLPHEVISSPTELNQALASLASGDGESGSQMDELASSDEEDTDQDDRAQQPAKEDGTGMGKTTTALPKRIKKRGTGFSDHLAALSHFNIGNEFFRTKGCVSRHDGRLKISLHETEHRGYLAKALGTGALQGRSRHSHEDGSSEAQSGKTTPKKAELDPAALKEPDNIPRLNICIIVIGSRGDIQPFMKIGMILKSQYGHRVRIATHPAFKSFVEKECGLEFFSIGGDPAELMAFMVKNPGLIPSMETIKEGEIGRRRAGMYEMFHGMWKACVNATDDESDKEAQKMNSWVCDAIIANPPSFAPLHIAERLGVPLSVFFTMPYTPTTSFPHPLANVKASNVDERYTNFISYPLVEMMTWQGLGDLINKFRERTLAMEPVSTLWAPGRSYRLKVPHTYMWSPGLVPKPEDWGPEINITGYVFLELASTFHPPDSLATFLDDGEPPVYIGFGSIVVDDPDGFTKMIFEAVEKAGVRALVSKGWGGFGNQDNIPENIYMLDNTPHDWLFPRVSACVIHGGAGTTAIALKCGRPTMVVSFFGDQPFWGAMIGRAGAGAQPVPFKKLTADSLAFGIKECLTDSARKNVAEIASRIEAEGDGAANAVKAFHRQLPLDGPNSMRCSILPSRVAVWHVRGTNVKISALAADILIEKDRIQWKDLQLVRNYDWNDYLGPGEPLTGISSAITGTISETVKGFGMVPVNMAKSVRTRTTHWRKKRRHERKVAQRAATVAKANAEAESAPTAREDPPVLEEAVESNDNRSGSASGPNATTNGSHLQPPRPQATRNITNETLMTVMSADPEDPIIADFARHTGTGIYRSAHAIFHLPLMLSLAVAQGFHNAPRLYGDPTVRRPIRITGVRSGLRAGRNEFLYGIYDAVSGLWRLPAQGWKDGGMTGSLKGMARGLGGFVLKDIAAVTGPIAYAMKGIHEQNQRRRQPTKVLRRARIVQGQQQRLELGPESEKTKATPAPSDEVQQQVLRAWDGGLADTVRRMRDRIIRDWGQERTFDYGEDGERARERAQQQQQQQQQDLAPPLPQPPQAESGSDDGSKLPEKGRPHSHTAPEILVPPELAPLANGEPKSAPQVFVIDGEEKARPRSMTDAQDFAARKVASADAGTRAGIAA